MALSTTDSRVVRSLLVLGAGVVLVGVVATVALVATIKSRAEAPTAVVTRCGDETYLVRVIDRGRVAYAFSADAGVTRLHHSRGALTVRGAGQMTYDTDEGSIDVRFTSNVTCPIR